MNSIEVYIKKLKTKLNEDVFSPSFIRLANLYFINEQYEDCINVCTIGLQVFPDYTTAKILLIKALLKLGYVGEAESLFEDVKNRILNLQIFEDIKTSIKDLKNKTGQERIFYPDNIHPSVEFKNYADIIDKINDTKMGIEFDEYQKLIESHATETTIDEDKLNIFNEKLHEFRFDRTNISGLGKADIQTEEKKEVEPVTPENLFLSKIKILTETIADIYSRQGFIKEAFEAYNILLQKDNQNKSRILEKLNELERNLGKNK